MRMRPANRASPLSRVASSVETCHRREFASHLSSKPGVSADIEAVIGPMLLHVDLGWPLTEALKAEC